MPSDDPLQFGAGLLMHLEAEFEAAKATKAAKDYPLLKALKERITAQRRLNGHVAAAVADLAKAEVRCI